MREGGRRGEDQIVITEYKLITADDIGIIIQNIMIGD